MVFRLRANDGPLIVVVGSSLPSSTKKNVVKVGPPPPPPPPRINKTFWLCNHVLCAKSALTRPDHLLTTTARDLKAVALMLILDIMLSLRLYLRLTILADSLGPDLVGLIQQSRGTYIYRRVVRKANSDMSRSSQGLPIFMEGKSIHSEIVKLEERQTVK